jgi:hypothetical protein
MASFADRLAWLLAVVPRHPDRPAEHLEMNELETALTATDERAGRSLDGTPGELQQRLAPTPPGRARSTSLTTATGPI